MTAEVVPFGLPRPMAEALIHKLAHEGKFVQEPVFIDKMTLRHFSMRQMLETIKNGTVNQGPRRDEYGDWRCRMKRRVAGRLVHVVVAIHDMSFLYLISIH
jgi:hypothetical protein